MKVDERAGVIAEIAKGDGRAFGGIVGVDIVLLDFEVQGFLFECPDAHETPARDGEIFDESGLVGRLREEFIFEGPQEFAETAGVLVFEHDGLGEEAVADGVAGRTAFSLGCFWAARQGPVLLRGADAPVSTHTARLSRGEGAYLGELCCKVLSNQVDKEVCGA